MILSVSRRTDVPAFYSDWFFDRLSAGEIVVPNPFSGKSSVIKLEPIKIQTNILGGVEVSGGLEGIIFWSKNPAPMLERLDKLKEIPHYFQFTLNAYGLEYESRLPPLDERVQTFKSLAARCPVVWRYDPIFLSRSIGTDWHFTQFENLAKRLEGSTKICIINTLRGHYSDAYCPDHGTVKMMVEEISRIAKRYNIEVQACAEISNSGIILPKAKCADPSIFEQLTGRTVKKSKLSGASRIGCDCMKTVDIGTYGTCQKAAFTPVK